jgi:hypothetical protein
MERFKEKLAIKIAWLLPRRIALWAMVRVASYASTGPWGNEHPDSIDFKKMHDRWQVLR